MQVNRHRVEVVTGADEKATAYTPRITGQLVNIIYKKPSADGLDAANFAITGEDTGLNIWTENSVDASKAISPTQPLHDQAGAERIYAAVETGSDPLIVSGPICLADERVKIEITSGGAAKKGTFDIIVVGPSG